MVGLARIGEYKKSTLYLASGSLSANISPLNRYNSNLHERGSLLHRYTIGASVYIAAAAAAPTARPPFQLVQGSILAVGLILKIWFFSF